MEIFYFGHGDPQLFGVLHRSARLARLGLIFCQPYGEEITNSYARFARWAKHLAEQGMAVMRFHYRGTGESDGASWEFDFEAACADTKTAVAHLQELVPGAPICLFGYRFGATVAAQVAAQVKPDFLLLWAPVLNLSAYLRELLRLRLTKELIRQGDGQVEITRSEMIQRLEAGECVDVLGYELSPSFYHQLRDSDPWASPPVGTQVLWLARSQDAVSGAEKARQWQQANVSAEFLSLPEIVFWEEFPQDLPPGFASHSLEWLRQRMFAPQEVGAS